MIGAFGDNQLKRELEHVQDRDFVDLDVHRLAKNVFFPTLELLLELIAVPSIFSLAVFPKLESNFELQVLCFHWSYIGYTVLLFLLALIKKALMYCQGLQNKILEDKYVVGKELANYERTGHK